jgi:hypothetical protein
VFITTAVVAFATGCAVPEINFYGDDGGPDTSFDVTVGDDVSNDGIVAEGGGGDDSGDSGDDGGEVGACGAPTCCGSIPCFGECTDCDACASKCGGGGQECCVKQTLVCRSVGTSCP